MWHKRPYGWSELIIYRSSSWLVRLRSTPFPFNSCYFIYSFNLTIRNWKHRNVEWGKLFNTVWLFAKVLASVPVRTYYYVLYTAYLYSYNMFKLLSYKFLVCLELPGKANLHNLPLSFFLGKVDAPFARLVGSWRQGQHSTADCKWVCLQGNGRNSERKAEWFMWDEKIEKW